VVQTEECGKGVGQAKLQPLKALHWLHQNETCHTLHITSHSLQVGSIVVGTVHCLSNVSILFINLQGSQKLI